MAKPPSVSPSGSLTQPENIVVARHRARQVASSAGLDASSETRLAASVSEISATRSPMSGRPRYVYDNPFGADCIVVLVRDCGPGIADLDAVLEVRTAGRGISSARRLVDGFTIGSGPGGTTVTLSRLLMDRTDGPLTAEQERQVTYIRRSAESLNDLLDLAKVEAGKQEIRPSYFTLSELFGVLRGAKKPLQQNDAVDLIFEEPADCPTLFTDEAKVAQTLRNLISNALKFTERGEVRVAAVFDSETRNCSLEVADTGIGIAPEDHDLVFQDFSQSPQHAAIPRQGHWPRTAALPPAG